VRDLIRFCTKHTPHSLKTLQTQVLIDAIDDIIHHIHCRRTKASFFTSRVVINEIKGVFLHFTPIVQLLWTRSDTKKNQRETDCLISLFTTQTDREVEREQT